MTNEIEAKNKINDSSDNVGSAGNSSDTANPKSFVSCTDLKNLLFHFRLRTEARGLLRNHLRGR